MPKVAAGKKKTGAHLFVEWIVLFQEKTALKTALAQTNKKGRAVIAMQHRLQVVDAILAENNVVIARKFNAIKHQYGY